LALKLLILIGCILFSLSASAGISETLMALAGDHKNHKGHSSLENHRFIKSLHKNDFSETQIAQFFRDRIYILKTMENVLANATESHELSLLDFRRLPAKDKLFFRSFAYQDDLDRLLEQTQGIAPPVSGSAIQYGEYLQNSQTEKVAIHLWLFLIGETFGTQSIGRRINERFHSVGIATRTFESFTPSQVRKEVNQWIDQMISDRSNQYEKEIGLAYFYLIQLFEEITHDPNLDMDEILQEINSQNLPIESIEPSEGKVQSLLKRFYSYLGY
jgi:heme oxygenase